MHCIHQPSGKTVAAHTQVANTFWSRLKGLLGKDMWGERDALLITPCNSVHTIGMQSAIDVIFLSKNNQVLHIISHMVPNRMSQIIWQAAHVLELPAGKAADLNIQTGEHLLFESG